MRSDFYSAEVENAMSEHSAVAVSAAIGIPSEQWGEAVHAVIVLNATCSATEHLAGELIAHCRQTIAGRLLQAISVCAAWSFTLRCLGAYELATIKLCKISFAEQLIGAI
jgi:acyl-CoA synthetase (AMP-forming)/AMP-acid ligase II